jgi:hypothetical protein
VSFERGWVRRSVVRADPDNPLDQRRPYSLERKHCLRGATFKKRPDSVGLDGVGVDARGADAELTAERLKHCFGRDNPSSTRI